jgi:hypothetical protein
MGSPPVKVSPSTRLSGGSRSSRIIQYGRSCVRTIIEFKELVLLEDFSVSRDKNVDVLSPCVTPGRWGGEWGGGCSQSDLCEKSLVQRRLSPREY